MANNSFMLMDFIYARHIIRVDINNSELSTTINIVL